MQTLKDTKHPKDKTFDKIYAMMLETCVENIDERTSLKVIIFLTKIQILDPDNFQVWENKYNRFITFNKKIFAIIGPEVKYTAKEKELLDLIHKVKLSIFSIYYFKQAKLNDDLTASVYEGVTSQAYYPYEEYSYYLIGAVLGFLTFIIFLITGRFIK